MASSTMAEHVIQLYRAIYAVVRRIPRGRVATYGQVAELAGIPGGARVAGAALKTSQPSDKLPWQRVIGKAGTRRGRIAIHHPVGAAIQRQLLADEGVPIGDTGLVALDRYGWLPGSSSSLPKLSRAKPTGRAKSTGRAKPAGRAKPTSSAKRRNKPPRATKPPR